MRRRKGGGARCEWSNGPHPPQPLPHCSPRSELKALTLRESGRTPRHSLLRVYLQRKSVLLFQQKTKTVQEKFKFHVSMCHPSIHPSIFFLYASSCTPGCSNLHLNTLKSELRRLPHKKKTTPCWLLISKPDEVRRWKWCMVEVKSSIRLGVKVLN